MSYRMLSGLLTALLILCAYPLPTPAESNSARELEEGMNETLQRMKAESEDWIKNLREKGIAAAPDFSRKLRRLEQQVDRYLASFAPSIPVNNPLENLSLEHGGTAEADLKELTITLKNVDMLSGLYFELYQKYLKKHQQIVFIAVNKLVIDILSLPAALSRTLWVVAPTAMTQVIESMQKREFIPLGDLPVGRKTMERTSEEMRELHHGLMMTLRTAPANRDEFIKLVGKARYQSKDCWEKATELQKDLRTVKKEVNLRNENIRDFLKKISDEVEKILSRKAHLVQLTISPSPLELAHVGDATTTEIIRRYDTGLQLPAKFSDIIFDYDLPRLVTFTSSVDGQISVKGIAAGKNEVRFSLAENGNTGRGSADVIVSSGPTPSPTSPAIATPTSTAPPLSTPSNTPALLSTTPPSSTSSTRNYFKFTLSKSDIIMGFNQHRYLKATAWYTKIPRFIPQDVTADPNTTWTTSWSEIATVYDGVIRSNAKQGECAISAVFKTPGGKSLTASCKVAVKYLPEKGPPVDFRIEPDQSSYRVGQELKFIQMVSPPHTNLKFTWNIRRKWEKYGPTVKHAFESPGKHTVVLRVRSTFTGMESSMTKTVNINQPIQATPTPGEPPVITLITPMPRPDAKWRNRFEAEKTGKGLEFRSSYFDLSQGKWSEPRPFGIAYKGDTFIVATGEQADGINSGWIIYYYLNGRQPVLRYVVASFKFSQKLGFIVYQGELNLHNKTPIPKTLKFKEVKPWGTTVEWSCTDGSLCRAEISKYQKSGQSMVKGGVTDLGCIEGNKRGMLKEALQAAAQQQNINPGEVLSIPLEDLKMTARRRDCDTPNCGFNVTGNLSNANDGSVSVGVFDDAKAAEECLIKWYEYYADDTGFYNLEVAWTSFHGLKAFTWSMCYSDKTLKKAKRIAPETWRESFKDWIGYTQYGIAWIQDNAWVALYTKQKTPAGRNALEALAEAVYTEMAAISDGSFYCDGEVGQAVEMITYRSTEWPVRLNHGKLEVGGARGSTTSWKEGQWKQIDTEVTDFSGRGTSQGPVIVYQKGNTWHVVMMDWAGGAIKNPRSFFERVTVKQAGKLGVVLQVDDKCYDYSLNHLKEVDCTTGLYK